MNVNLIPMMNAKHQRVDALDRRLVPATFCRDGNSWLAIFLCPDCQHRWTGRLTSDEHGEPLPETLIPDRLHEGKRNTCTPRAIVLYEHRRLERTTCGNPQRPHTLANHGWLEWGTLRFFCAKCDLRRADAEDVREYDLRYPENPMLLAEQRAVADAEAELARLDRLEEAERAGDTAPESPRALSLSCLVRRRARAPLTP